MINKAFFIRDEKGSLVGTKDIVSDIRYYTEKVFENFGVFKDIFKNELEYTPVVDIESNTVIYIKTVSASKVNSIIATISASKKDLDEFDNAYEVINKFIDDAVLAKWGKGMFTYPTITQSERSRIQDIVRYITYLVDNPPFVSKWKISCRLYALIHEKYTINSVLHMNAWDFDSVADFIRSIDHKVLTAEKFSASKVI